MTSQSKRFPTYLPQHVKFYNGWKSGIVALFTIEYCLRILVSDRRFSFVFSFYGIVDLLAILPFYLAIGLDLRSVRILRFLRVLRVLKLGRYSRALQRLRAAVYIAREEIILFGAAALGMLYLAAVAIYYFEREAQPEKFASVFHSLWWAIVTMTTVGYGDVYPITVGGRIFTAILLVLALGVVAVPTGLLASALSQARQLDSDGTTGPDMRDSNP